MTDKDLEETIKSLNPVFSHFLSKQKLDYYLLESWLSERRKIISDRFLMKSQNILVKSMGSRGRIWDYLESPKKDDSECVIILIF